MGRIQRLLYGCLGLAVSTLVPVKQNRVAFQSYFGNSFSCNPRYIADELISQYGDELEYYVFLNEKDDALDERFIQVKPNTFEALVAWSSSKVWVDNSRTNKFVRKKSGQRYIQTWHAYLGPKRCERDVEDALDSSYVRLAKADGANTDLMFADNDLQEELYKTSFWYDGPVVRCGVPRNKPLISVDDNCKSRVFADLGIAEGSLFCLYAPTFRNTYSSYQYDFDAVAVQNALSKVFGKPVTVGYRLHPNVANTKDLPFSDNAVNCTHYPEAQDLICACDVMISDYSSIMEDFALMKKPGFMYAPDYDDYVNDRGFRYDLEKRPFPLSRNMSELVDQINSYDESESQKKYAAFFDWAGIDDDGHGAEYLAKVIYGWCCGGNQ